MKPEDDENTSLIHDFYSTLFNEHIGKVPNGDHNPFKPKDTNVKVIYAHESLTNFLNNWSCEGQTVTKDKSPTLGTETAHVLKTKDLGGRTEVRPRAQELVKNNGKGKGKRIKS